MRLLPFHFFCVLLSLMEGAMADPLKLYVNLEKLRADVDRFDSRNIYCAGCEGFLGLDPKDCNGGYERSGSCGKCAFINDRKRCIPLVDTETKCEVRDPSGTLMSQWTWTDKVRVNNDWKTVRRLFDYGKSIRDFKSGWTASCGVRDKRNGIQVVNINACSATFDQLKSGSEIECKGNYGAYKLNIIRFSWDSNDPWSACSSECKQTRNVECRIAKSTGADYNEDFCDQSKKPATWEPCTSGQCTSTFNWVTEWDSCDVTCGSGNQYPRSQTCASNTGVTVDDRFCEDKQKPTSRPCSVGTCPSPPPSPPMPSSPPPSPPPVSLSSPPPSPPALPPPSPSPSQSPTSSAASKSNHAFFIPFEAGTFAAVVLAMWEYI